MISMVIGDRGEFVHIKQRLAGKTGGDKALLHTAFSHMCALACCRSSRFFFFSIFLK